MPRALLLPALVCALAGCGSDNAPAQAGGSSESGLAPDASTGDAAVDRGQCDRFVACAEDVGFNPATVAVTYGPEGVCWDDSPPEVCRAQCEDQLAMLGASMPDVAACFECESEADCEDPEAPRCSLTHRCEPAFDACAQYCAKAEECCPPGLGCGGVFIESVEDCVATCEQGAAGRAEDCQSNRENMLECAIGLSCQQFSSWLPASLGCYEPEGTCGSADLGECRDVSEGYAECLETHESQCRRACACDPEACANDPDAACVGAENLDGHCRIAIGIYDECIRENGCDPDDACAFQAAAIREDCDF